MGTWRPPETYKDRLPTAAIGKSCVRFKHVDDLDQAALKQLIREGAEFGPIGQV